MSFGGTSRTDSDLADFSELDGDGNAVVDGRTLKVAMVSGNAILSASNPSQVTVSYSFIEVAGSSSTIDNSISISQVSIDVNGVLAPNFTDAGTFMRAINPTEVGLHTILTSDDNSATIRSVSWKVWDFGAAPASDSEVQAEIANFGVGGINGGTTNTISNIVPLDSTVFTVGKDVQVIIRSTESINGQYSYNIHTFSIAPLP